MASVSSEASLGLDEVIGRYDTLLTALATTAGANTARVSELLLVRDHLATAICEPGTLTPDLAAKVCRLDVQLQGHSKAIRFIQGSTLSDLRALISPPKRNWWWYPERPSPLWTIGALLLLALSVSTLTDFTRRLLNSDPDELGILSIGVQALLTVGASSTFTESGRKWVERLLSRYSIPIEQQTVVKFCGTVALFLVVFVAWRTLPTSLAMHYNARGFFVKESQPETALRLYERAVSLDPGLPEPHVNLGALYEHNYDYGNAAAEYRKAIAVDATHVKAYNNLARVLLLTNEPFTALRVVDDAFAVTAPNERADEISAALFKNRAWAEYQLGFYPEAETDGIKAAAFSGSAASAYCVLAKVYTKMEKQKEADQAWKQFLVAYASSATQTMIEPDCTRLAHGATHENR